MRVIKFRAWIRQKGKKPFMIIPTEFETIPLEVITLNGKVLKLDENFQNNTAKPAMEYLPNDIFLMQFTGLLDKNGKEIYEGDIVETDPDIWLNHIKEFHVVVYKAPGFIPSELISSDGFEVIGNIYENPELLKDL